MHASCRIIVSVFIAAALSAEHIIDLNAGEEYTLTQYASAAAESGISNGAVRADTREASGTWIHFFTSKPGLFKPNTEYVILFDYMNVELADDSFLHCVVRDPVIGDSSTLKSINMPETGRIITKKITLRIPNNANYSLIFYMKKKGIALVGNIRLFEGGYGRIIPASADAVRSQRTPALPRGPAEFSIEQPDAPVNTLSASDFGVRTENTNNFAALNAAIEACRTRNIRRLVLSPGTYHFDSMEDTVVFNGLTNFILDGRGAELIFFRPRYNRGWPFMHISNCHRTAFINVSIDWDWSRTPLASIVRVLSSASNGTYIDVEFTEHERFPAPNAEARSFEPLDEQMKLGYENAKESGERLTRAMQWLAPNRARISTGDPYIRWLIASQYTNGMHLRLRHFNYDMGGMRIYNSTHITLSNAAVYSAPGMAVHVSGDTHHLWLNRVRIAPKADAPRCISATADHFHVNNSKGYIKIEHSEMGMGGDDCVNIHDNNFFGTRTAEKEFLAQHYRWWATPLSVGDPIEFRTDMLAATGVTARIVSMTENRPKEECALILDTPLPEGGPFFVCYNRRYGSHEYIIRDNIFRENRASTFRIQADNGLIERNRFIRAQYPAIRLETGYSMKDWCEGYGISNLIIRNNVFENCNVNNYEEHSPIIHMGVFLKATSSPDLKTPYPVFSAILVESNHFQNSTGAAMTISSAAGIVVRSNLFTDTTPRITELPVRAMIVASFASNIAVIDNRWVRSPFVASPGLRYESDSCASITAAGNVLAEP